MLGKGILIVEGNNVCEGGNPDPTVKPGKVTLPTDDVVAGVDDVSKEDPDSGARSLPILILAIRERISSVDSVPVPLVEEADSPKVSRSRSASDNEP
jgi:hypothetical protein